MAACRLKEEASERSSERRRVAAVIFDMDGTLLDTEGVGQLATKAAISSLGFPISDELCRSLIGIPDQEGGEMLRRQLEPDFPAALFVDRFVEERRAAEATVALKPGAREIVAFLSERGVPIAIATSSDRSRAERLLTMSGLRGSFPVVVARDEVARGKPHPDLFLEASARLGIAAADCLVIEDAPAGLLAAHAAGAMPVMVPDVVQPTAEIRRLCVHVGRDLNEVQRLIERGLPRLGDLDERT